MRWKNLKPLTRQFHVDSSAGLDCAENKFDIDTDNKVK